MPVGPIIGAAISAASQIGQGMLGHFFQKKSNQDQRAYEAQMWVNQARLNRTNWNLENQYNLPENQIKRMRDAGLNPALMYGQPQSAMGGNLENAKPNTSNSTNTYNPAANINAAGLVDQIYDLRQKNAQIDATNQSIVESQSRVAQNQANTDLKMLLQDSQKLQNALGKDTYNAMVRQKIADLQETYAKINNLNTSSRVNQALEPYYRSNTIKTTDENIRAWQQNEVSLVQAWFNVNKKSPAELSNIYSDTRYKNQATNTSRQQQLLTELETWMYNHNYNPKESAVGRIISQVFNSGKELTHDTITWIKEQLKKTDKAPKYNNDKKHGFRVTDNGR